MLNLSCFQHAQLQPHPFPHAVISNLMDQKQALKLTSSLPDEHLYYSQREHGSDKTYKVANSILLELGSTLSDSQHLPSEWQRLLQALTSDAYIQPLSTLLDTDLSQCYQEITLKQYQQHDFISPHTDRDWVTATHLLFFNLNWQPEWGGQLELLNDQHQPFLAVKPTFDQSIAFVRTDNSWHAVPPILHPSEKRFTLQVAFWNTLERSVLPGRINSRL